MNYELNIGVGVVVKSSLFDCFFSVGTERSIKPLTTSKVLPLGKAKILYTKVSFKYNIFANIKKMQAFLYVICSKIWLFAHLSVTLHEFYRKYILSNEYIIQMAKGIRGL